jgi:hypothetical protein
MNIPSYPFCKSTLLEYYRNSYAINYDCLNCNIIIFYNLKYDSLDYILFSKESYKYNSNNSIATNLTNSKIFKNSIPKYLISTCLDLDIVQLFSFNLKTNNYSVIKKENYNNSLSKITPDNFDKKIKIILAFS